MFMKQQLEEIKQELKLQVRNLSSGNSGAHYNQYGGYSTLEVWEIEAPMQYFIEIEKAIKK